MSTTGRRGPGGPSVLSVPRSTIAHMSIHGLMLDGWDRLSTWGYDDLMDSYYAQLTCNGHSDDDGPDVWITPGSSWPAIHHAEVLAEAIVEATGAPLDDVRAAMAASPTAGADLPGWWQPHGIDAP
jgi:hypothetical protein